MAGNNPFEIPATVLVSEDTILGQKTDHNLRLMMFRGINTQPGPRMMMYTKAPSPPWSFFTDPVVSNYSVVEAYTASKGAIAPASTPLAMLTPPTRNWNLNQDTFVSVYPVQEYTSQYTQAPGSKTQPFPMLFWQSRRPPDPDEEFRRTDLLSLFRLRGPAVAQHVGYTFDQPDFNDNPWLEWVHPKASDESSLFPFRQIYTVPLAQWQYTINFYQSPNWRIEAESDTVNRQATLYPLLGYARPEIVTEVVPNIVGLQQAAAIELLTSVSLLSGVVTVGYSSSPAGTVLAQSPVAGTIVLPFTFVNYEISEGPAPGTMPYVIGMFYLKAIQALAALGLVITVKEKVSNTVRPKFVIGQEPVAGSPIVIGQAVTILVSRDALLAVDTTQPYPLM
jgi:hypothetical protein